MYTALYSKIKKKNTWCLKYIYILKKTVALNILYVFETLIWVERCGCDSLSRVNKPLSFINSLYFSRVYLHSLVSMIFFVVFQIRFPSSRSSNISFSFETIFLIWYFCKIIIFFSLLQENILHLVKNYNFYFFFLILFFRVDILLWVSFGIKYDAT